ncbi:MAG: chemotaxis protein CheA [Campylobacterales bacterium]|nr:chemotaxis protein CheA [Campylobacterales bacterium]
MNKEKLKEIFIEEANEIIEKLDVDIIEFEQNPSEKAILHELFRGVHTLKGSANSFGFTRLGEFVHHFEDVLDFYRNSDIEVSSETIDVFLEAVDIIKEVLVYEITQSDGLPENYEKCLQDIRAVLNEEPVEKSNKSLNKLNDLAIEFEDIEVQNSNENENELFQNLEKDETLYKIILTLGSDIYFRGYDHLTFLNMLALKGRFLKTSWDLTKVPPLDKLELLKSYHGDIVIYLASKFDKHDIEDVFEFLESTEFYIEEIKKSEIEPTKTKEPEIEQKVEIKQVEAKKDKDEVQSSNETKENSKKPVHHDEKKSFVKIDTNKLDELFDSIGELVIAQNFLSENEEIKKIKNEGVTKTLDTLSKITRLIQNRVMSLRMVPIKDTFEKMKRVVRDTSRKVNKEIKLVISGEDTEIDKTMVDSLSDPLIHMLRNAIDHGIEDSSEDRVNKGKSADGTIHLKAFHKGGNVAIEITDDGRGISKTKVLQKAKERGLYNGEDELTDTQIFNFIMQAGFSTTDKISDVSGRGVGLDVVRSSLEVMHGKIEIMSKEGEGTTFLILLPLTLAIIDGMLVKSSSETYIIPTLSIVESFRPDKAIVHSLKGKGEFVNLREEILPIVRLNKALEISTDNPPVWESTLVCVESEKGKYAILVDELIGRQQVVIKSIGEALSKLREISGGAILGNGEIALILNVDGLFTHTNEA